VGQLQGHTTSVVDLLVNEPDNQIITLGLDKCIKAWGFVENKRSTDAEPPPPPPPGVCLSGGLLRTALARR